MIASYTANLAAFLTVETLERPIESVEDLVAQNEILYGAMSDGSTAGFFQNSNNEVYRKVWQFMSGIKTQSISALTITTCMLILCVGIHQSEVMLKGNAEAVEKVENSNGKYAYFMESASIQYLKERRCKLSQARQRTLKQYRNHNRDFRLGVSLTARAMALQVDKALRTRPS